MENISFLAQYMIHPRSVGAILPSSRYLTDKMMGDIDFKNARYIIEYGPGTGVFTSELLKKRNSDTVLVVIESNDKFYKTLAEKYKGEDRVLIFHGSAENAGNYLVKHGIPHVDYVVSGLPFASLPRDVSDSILTVTRQILKKNGKFITFQYTKLKKDFISQYFGDIHIRREFRNVPPAYVFTCHNGSMENNEEKVPVEIE